MISLIQIFEILVVLIVLWHNVLIILLLSLLFEVLVMAALHTVSYFSPDSQAVLQCMLSDWARVQRSTVGQCEQHEDDVKKYQ